MPGHTQQDVADWARVREALASEEWDLRSLSGIARDAQLSPERVRVLIGQNRDSVRTSISRDKRVVYALKSKPVSAREKFDLLLTYAGS